MAAALLSLTDCCSPCDVCDVTIVSGDSSSVVGWFTRKSYLEAKAIPTLDTNEYLAIQGFVTGGTPGDSGVFGWDELSADGDDGPGGSIITPNDNPALGRWIRQS